MTARALRVQRHPGEALRGFSAVEKLLLTCEIALAYVEVRVRMRRGDLRGTLAALRASAPAEPTGDGEPVLDFAGRLGAIVDGRLRHLPGDTRCLTRSLVLVKLLVRRGLLNGTLVIGVRAEPKFGAHAWVELDGRSLLQPIEASGSRLVEL